MPRFAANLSMLFTELPLPERFAAAARAGFDAVEVQFPYAMDPADMAHALQDAGQRLVLHNLPAGDWAAGERGMASDPQRKQAFREGLELAMEYSLALDCTQLNCLAGVLPRGLDPEEAWATFRENLRYAAPRLAAWGRRLLIEPINTQDMPGFLLCRSDTALELIRTLELENLYLQFDAYHAHMMGEGWLTCLEAAGDRLAHVQIADAPGRAEPGTGAIDFRSLFRWLDAAAYSGHVGCEYRPSRTTEQSLNWLRSYQSGER